MICFVSVYVYFCLNVTVSIRTTAQCKIVKLLKLGHSFIIAVTHQKSYCSYHYIIFLFCLGRANPEPFQQKLNRMYQHFESIGVRMSVKMHYLRSHVNLFQSDLKNISDQHGERVHQTIAIFEKRFSHSTYIANMLADFLWINVSS